MSGRRYKLAAPRGPLGQPFWPRSEARQLPPAIHEIRDAPCANCGYNLRGLPPGNPCPECGAIRGRDLTVPALPWTRRPLLWAPAAYIATVWHVLVHGGEFAKQVWGPWTLAEDEADGFRRISRWLALVPLLVLITILTAKAVGLAAAVVCLPVNLAAAILGLERWTAIPAALCQDRGLPDASARAALLTHYLSAGLGLTPLHLLSLMWVFSASDLASVVPLVACGMVLVLQVGLTVRAAGRLLGELVELPVSAGIVYVAGLAGRMLLSLAAWFVGVPMFVATVARAVLW